MRSHRSAHSGSVKPAYHFLLVSYHPLLHQISRDLRSAIASQQSFCLLPLAILTSRLEIVNSCSMTPASHEPTRKRSSETVRMLPSTKSFFANPLCRTCRAGIYYHNHLPQGPWSSSCLAPAGKNITYEEKRVPKDNCRTSVLKDLKGPKLNEWSCWRTLVIMDSCLELFSLSLSVLEVSSLGVCCLFIDGSILSSKNVWRACWILEQIESFPLLLNQSRKVTKTASLLSSCPNIVYWY